MNVLFSHKRVEISQIFYIINITSFYLVNILNISCKLNKMKKEFLNLGPKLPYLGIFRLTFAKENIVTFEATSNCSKHQSFVQN